jgi:N-acetylneuraminic acid mutarotase
MKNYITIFKIVLAFVLINIQLFAAPSPVWNTFPNLPSITTFDASAILDNNLYVQTPELNSGVASTTVTRFFLGDGSETGSWSSVAGLPAARTGGSLTACNGKLYYIGGGGTSGISSGTNTVFEYDPSSNTWTTKANLPASLSGHSAVCYDNSVIYVIGGPWNSSGTNRNVYYYTPASNTWGTITNSLPLGMGRCSFSLGIWENKIIIAGGYNSAELKSTLIGTIGNDPSQITWEQVEDIPTEEAGIGRCGGVSLDGYHFLIGGEEGSPLAVSETTYVYSY